MKKKRIKIVHQLEKTTHYFLVADPKRLTRDEVAKICEKMGVDELFVERRLYMAGL